MTMQRRVRPMGPRPALVLAYTALAWVVAIAHGFAQRPPPGSPGGDFTGIATRPPAISGTVVDAMTGTPIAQSAVTLGPDNLTGSHQQTDDGGRFLFSNLSVRTAYEVTASKPGYFGGALGRDTWDEPPRRLVLTENEWVSDAVIRLFRPSAISGRVLDASGEPLAGVRVVSLSQIAVAGALRQATGPAVRTDDRGVYRIAPLPPGAYLLAVAAPAPSDALPQAGWSPAPHPVGRAHVHPMTFYPAARTLGAARPIVLGPSQERAATDITLQAAPAFSISGRVDRVPPDARRLRLHLVTQGNEPLGPSLATATAAVGEDGRFTFLDVPDGSYTIVTTPWTAGYVLVPPGTFAQGAGVFATPTSRLFIRTGPPETWLEATNRAATSYSARSPVVVTGGDVTGLVVPLSRTATIRGRVVTEDSVGVSGIGPPIARSEGLSVSRGQVGGEAAARLQEAIAGLSGITLVGEPSDGDPRLGLPETRTDGIVSPAAFSIEGVLSGAYFLRAPSASVKSVKWNGRDYTHTPLPVAAGQDITGVEVVVDRRPPNAGGTVRDEQYRDALDATVLVFPVERSRWRHAGLIPTALRFTAVGRGGAYRLSGLPAGEYYFVALAGQLTPNWQDHAFLERIAGVATRATVEWAQVRLPDLVAVELPR
jgi:hypothetical protein